MTSSANDSVMQALLYPFDKGLAAWPRGDVLLVNPAPFAPGLPDGARSVALWQWWKGHADALAAFGTQLPADGPDGAALYDVALVRLPRQREESGFVIATAWDRLKPGGLLVAAAANDAGGKRLEDDLGWAGPANATAKHKCRIVWLAKDKTLPPPDLWRKNGAVRRHPATGFITQPGLFSWDRIDPATTMLLAQLPAGLSGAVADLGCGYGVIADHVLRHSPAVDKVLCVDADARAVAACRANLAEKHPGRTADCQWADLSQPCRAGLVGTVIMNPPFHVEKAQSLALGRAFIANAAAMLKPGGTLFMVANMHLPYEQDLSALFAHVEPVQADKGFKIIKARK